VFLVQWRAAALARRLDDPHHPQAIDRSLSEGHAATQQRRQLTSAKRARWKRRHGAQDVVWSPVLGTIEHIDQPPLSWISSPATRLRRSNSANMILPDQQYLDGQMRMRQKRGKRNQSVKHLDDTGALWRAANRSDFAVPVNADDTPLGRHRTNDPKLILIEQRVKLRS
jgi:hypothetical protein